VKLSHKDIASIKVLIVVAISTIIWLSIYMGSHWRLLVNMTEPRWWCGLMSNYFDHLLLLDHIAVLRP